MKKKNMTYLIIISACFCILSVAFGTEPEIKKSIVKIYMTQTRPVFDKPWLKGEPMQFSGSGCIIEGNRILTNAHVVSDATFIMVSRYGDSEKHKARVEAISHETDLALLSVGDEVFFKNAKPLSLGELPEIQETVVVYGFPEGGEQLCLTRGVISRIEHQEYVHSGKDFLAIQVDAAINSGNSGGPAITDNKIIGIVMQGRDDAENIGYIVPTPIINHFLEDLEDGVYDGFPQDGIIIQSMENETLKSMYGLKKSESGILVTYVIPGSPAEGIIKPRDVIISIDGHDIADDGTVEFRPDERTSKDYFVQQHQIGETMSMEILREKNRDTIRLTLSKPLADLNLVHGHRYDAPPTYYIYGGLVFSPIGKDYLEAFAKKINEDALQAKDFIGYFTDDKIQSVRGEEIVNMINVLPHDANKGYHNMYECVIKEVNGKKIHNLRELISIVENDTNSNFIEFKTRANKYIVLNRKKVAEANAEINEIYGVVADRSADLISSEKISQVAYGK